MLCMLLKEVTGAQNDGGSILEKANLVSNFRLFWKPEFSK